MAVTLRLLVLCDAVKLSVAVTLGLSGLSEPENVGVGLPIGLHESVLLGERKRLVDGEALVLGGSPVSRKLCVGDPDTVNVDPVRVCEADGDFDEVLVLDNVKDGDVDTPGLRVVVTVRMGGRLRLRLVVGVWLESDTVSV